MGIRLRNYRRSYGDRRDKGRQLGLSEATKQREARSQELRSTRRPEDGEIYRAQRAQRDMVY